MENNENKKAERSLKVTKIKSYSRDEFRPENRTAEIFAELLGQKNLTPKDVTKIKELGFKVFLIGGEL